MQIKRYDVVIVVGTIIAAAIFFVLNLIAENTSIHMSSGDYTLVTNDGRSRSYSLYVPPTYKQGGSTPLVVALHGAGNNHISAETHFGLNTLAATAHFIVVYPNGLQNPTDENDRTWNAGSCCGYTKGVNVDDVSFIELLLKNLSAGLSIDPNRIYAFGYSNGGLLAYRLACELSDAFAAIASISGGPGEWRKCKPTTPVSVMNIRTDANSVEGSAKKFRIMLAWDQCDVNPLESNVIAGRFNGKSISGIAVEYICQSDVAQIGYHFGIGKHGWPPLKLEFKPKTKSNSQFQTIPQAVWDFFREHPKMYNF